MTCSAVAVIPEPLDAHVCVRTGAHPGAPHHCCCGHEWPYRPPVTVPPADLVMVVDLDDVAHVMAGVESACGRARWPHAALSILLLLAKPWWVLCDRTYRPWPPTPCARCLAFMETP